MKYVNVPLPKPIIDLVDKIISDESKGFRSRPDFILHHIRIALKEEDKNALQNTYTMSVLRQGTD